MAGKRKKGEGTVRLRKDGRWEGRVVVGYDETGNPKTKNVLAKTKRECVEKLEKLEDLGWLEEKNIDNFIRIARQKGKNASLVWLLHLKKEKNGFKDRDFSL